jgi:hypothetical protein
MQVVVEQVCADRVDESAGDDCGRCVQLPGPDGRRWHSRLAGRRLGGGRLPGSQTRRHEDLGIAIEERDVTTAVAALRRRGYASLPRGDTRPWNFVLADEAGHHVDFHVIVLDEGRSGVYGPPENGEYYPAEALTGTGTVKGHTVACITPEWLVRWADWLPVNRRMIQPLVLAAVERILAGQVGGKFRKRLPRPEHRAALADLLRRARATV